MRSSNTGNNPFETQEEDAPASSPTSFASVQNRCERMVPEFPCPDSSTSAAKAAEAFEMKVKFSAAEARSWFRAGRLRQMHMFEPVSPSAIGKTCSKIHGGQSTVAISLWLLDGYMYYLH